MKRIVLIIPYFGTWPLWFPAFLKSCAGNPSIDWLFFTDCDIEVSKPENVLFYQSTLQDIRELSESKLNCSVALTAPRKLCDLRPAYGHIFQEYISNYDFWGFCDVDIIWGDIRKFITPELLNTYDIISSRKQKISGHFTIFKNTALVNAIWKSLPNYNMLLKEERFMWADEQVLTKHLKNLEVTKSPVYKIFWNTILLNHERGVDSHQEYYLDTWQWHHGRIIHKKTQEEVMYLHFINWKKWMHKCEVNYLDKETIFYISYTGIHYKPHTAWQLTFNHFKNIFNGYWVNDRRRIKKLKLKSYLKRFKRKLGLID